MGLLNGNPTCYIFIIAHNKSGSCWSPRMVELQRTIVCEHCRVYIIREFVIISVQTAPLMFCAEVRECGREINRQGKMKERMKPRNR